VLNAAIAISISSQYYRVVRNHTQRKTELFIEAAQAMGASTWAVLSAVSQRNSERASVVHLNAADAI